MRPKRCDFIFPLIFIIESLHIASKSISTVLVIYIIYAYFQAKRQRIQQTVPRIKPTDINQAGFIKQTVSSTLRKVETTENQPPKSPPKTPTKCPQRGTPIKHHDSQERLCDQIQLSPRSPAARRLEDEVRL